MTPRPGFRIMHDTMGPVEVPERALWGPQTQRAAENFQISGRGLDPELVSALALIKQAAAQVNAELVAGTMTRKMAQAISDAAQQIIDGHHSSEFPIDTFQTGSGTSSNMNVNEVIAAIADRAGVAVHANDHVNMSQSSNDVFPSAIHVAAAIAVKQRLIPELTELASTLDAKAAQFEQVVKAGRTHLMDATPVTLGQELHGYAAQVSRGIERLTSVLPRLAELPLGGTAVGTGINTPPGFAPKVIERLRQATGLPELSEARNHFEAQGARDALVECSGQLRVIAVSLYKIANDIRWMGSGPRAGLRELRIPDLQPGSSIMPGKVNPVACEAVRQVAAQVVGNDAAVAFAGSQGDFELNVMLPVMARNLLESIRILENVSRFFRERCIAGLEADVEVCRAYAEGSPSIVTPLNPYLGYEEGAAVAKQALAENRTIREVVIARGHVASGKITEAQLDEALDVLRMTHP